EARAQTTTRPSFDVLHYDAQVEPDIMNQTVTGKVLIRLISRADNLATIVFDCGDLTIDAVHESGEAQGFVRRDRQLEISLSRPARPNEKREIEIEYHGKPRRGIRFFPERAQVYTVFSTSQWLVCLDAPDDKATLRLKLIVPADFKTVANGSLAIQRRLPGNKIAFEWRQVIPVPTYTFGFAAGRFRTLTEQRGRVQLRYLATQFSAKELSRIFRDTADMISFYEMRAGVRYADSTYTQILAPGGIDQEMSGFTVMNEGYGREVLANERDVWLGAHELAHQWWGNMVTCRDWNHFWLNEGMATFMAAAYKEHRFGRSEYLREIEANRVSYQKVRDAGKDRSLVFPNWSNPTRADRTLVYDKGSYVLHLLREELGERDFWAGIGQYTRRYFGKSVTTPDFQRVMEHASGKDLNEFFAKWVYLTKQ
ncbi:MAG: M1 family metallopeptidase, partial [Pyrinomonadaceae bacterium]|nr:M1 family metallopeptidase [Pyrinomonadaceae bacterium]